MRLRIEFAMMLKNSIKLIAAVALACFASGVAAQVSSGTAFAITPGLLVTNQHVVAGCGSVEVIASDGRRVASVVDADVRIDLALLSVSGLKGATARLRNPRNVRLGESVMVFGFPLTGALSSDGNFTSGLVSALRGLRDAAGELQITAPIQPGNSGGPLMDASGLVIGVVQSKLDAIRSVKATGDIPQNVNFAISLEVLAEFLAKNRVAFRDGPLSAPLDTDRVADLAQSFTYRVECRGRPQLAEATPSIKPRQPPSCPGSYNVATWTNCLGEATYPSGQKYVGEFKDGKAHGQGTRTFFDGAKYIGEFKDDTFNGQGTLTFSNGRHKYVGEFKDGKLNGQATVTSPDGRKHVGEFRDGKPNGQGTQMFPDGAKYVGEFKDDTFNGRGTYTWPDGRKYVGEFKDGKRYGQGTSYDPNGSIRQSGFWENNVFVGSR